MYLVWNRIGTFEKHPAGPPLGFLSPLPFSPLFRSRPWGGGREGPSKGAGR